MRQPMCNAFSCIVQQNGNVLWKFAVDSHDELLTLYGALYGLSDTIADQQTLSFARVEVVPANANYLTPDRWILKVDQAIKPYWWGPAYEIYAMDAHRQWLTILDKILVRKPTVNPLTDIKAGPVTKESLKLLKEWASVRASVWDSVWDSVWASVVDSVGDSVRAQIGSLFALKRNEWKYTDKIKTKGYPFQPCVDLWNAGFVPSFDGKTWRLHSGAKAEVVYESRMENSVVGG